MEPTERVGSAKIMGTLETSIGKQGLTKKNRHASDTGKPELVVAIQPDVSDAAPGLGTLSVWDDIVEDSAQPSTVLVLDSVEVNRRLLRGMLRNSPYRILEAKRPHEALELLTTEKVDLVVVDLMMPEMSGTDFCRRLKSDKQTQLIPILMLTNIQGSEGEIAGISSGADEFLVKPLQPQVVRTRVRAMLRNKALIDSLEEAETILFALAQSVEKRDRHTGEHCHRLAQYSILLGRGLGLPPSDLRTLHRGGYLHDIGKIAIPDSILFKSGSLTDEEWRVMRTHTLTGENICRPMKSLAGVLPIVRNHHEKWDGTGYPDGLKGEDIPLLARILQISDIYDALTSRRPYKRAFTHEETLQIMTEEARRGWRDPRLVSLFGDLLDPGARPLNDAGLAPVDEINSTLSLANISVQLAKLP
jgi:putative two-component system response regulator